MTKYLWALILCVAVGLSVAGCGADDDDDGPMAGAAGVGGSAGSPVAATGGTPAGSGGSAGSGMTMMPVTCGTATCMASGPMIPAGFPIPAGIFPAPCCINAAMNQCGVSSMGGPCMPPPPPPTPHMNCPGRAGMMGCCTASGDCGQDASALGMGCVENGAAAAAVGSFIMIPPPKRCDVPLSDAGMMMDQDAGAE